MYSILYTLHIHSWCKQITMNWICSLVSFSPKTYFLSHINIIFKTDPRTVSMRSVYPAEQDSCYPCDGCLLLTEWAADNTVRSRTPQISSGGCTCALWKSVFATTHRKPHHRLPWMTLGLRLQAYELKRLTVLKVPTALWSSGLKKDFPTAAD